MATQARDIRNAKYLWWETSASESFSLKLCFLQLAEPNLEPGKRLLRHGTLEEGAERLPALRHVEHQQVLPGLLAHTLRPLVVVTMRENAM